MISESLPINEIVKMMNQKRIEYSTMEIPTVKWKLFRECNYSCPYCTVYSNTDEDPSDDKILEYVKAVIESIPRNWRVYLTGGEVTVRKFALETVLENLTKNDHAIRIITNFSESVDYYVYLHELSGGKLNSLFLTRHTCFDKLTPYVNKVLNLRSRLPNDCEILVRQVVGLNNDEVMDFINLRKLLEKQDIELFPLRLVLNADKNKMLQDYTQAFNDKMIAEIFRKYPNFPHRFGTYCPAGYEYAYIAPSLDVYSCMPYKNDEEGLLGNCLEGDVEINAMPMLCKMQTCYCVPGR